MIFTSNVTVYSIIFRFITRAFDVLLSNEKHHIKKKTLKMLPNEPSFAKIGLDTAENGPVKITASIRGSIPR